MFNFVLLYFLFHLKMCDSANGLIQLHFNFDKSYLIENLETNENDVTFKNIPAVTNLRDPLIDITCCFRLKLDFISRQVFKVVVDIMKDSNNVIEFSLQNKKERMKERKNYLKNVFLSEFLSKKNNFGENFYFYRFIVFEKYAVPNII
jgi:hypothetical protein